MAQAACDTATEQSTWVNLILICSTGRESTPTLMEQSTRASLFGDYNTGWAGSLTQTIKRYSSGTGRMESSVETRGLKATSSCLGSRCLKSHSSVEGSQQGHYRYLRSVNSQAASTNPQPKIIKTRHQLSRQLRQSPLQK